MKLNDKLIRASIKGHTKTVKILLKRGANVHAKDDAPLIRASSRGYVEIVKLLLDRGANIQAQNNKSLRWASKFGRTEVVEVLRKHYFKQYGNKFKCHDCLIKSVCTKICNDILI